MRNLILALMSLALLVSTVRGQALELHDLENELSAMGVEPTGLLNFSEDELITAMTEVGGEKVLSSFYSQSKLVYRAQLTIFKDSDPIRARVSFSGGDKFLSPETSVDVSEAATAFALRSNDVHLRGMATRSILQVAVKCLAITGQGNINLKRCGIYSTDWID